MKKTSKVLTLLLCAVLLIAGTVAGTVAYLSDSSETVTNTFSVGNIDIEMKEHALGADGQLTDTETVEEDSYKILPGTQQPKDPFVRIFADSEACYVFVQVWEVNNAASDSLRYVSWEIDDQWTLLKTENNVSTYYLTLNHAMSDEDEEYNVLKDKTVSYSENLTKDMIDALGENVPQLVFKGFAVQLGAASTADDAWAQVASESLPPQS